MEFNERKRLNIDHSVANSQSRYSFLLTLKNSLLCARAPQIFHSWKFERGFYEWKQATTTTWKKARNGNGDGNYGDLHDDEKQMNDKDDDSEWKESKDLEWGRIEV
jgi:hypothetical protein